MPLAFMLTTLSLHAACSPALEQPHYWSKWPKSVDFKVEFSLFISPSSFFSPPSFSRSVFTFTFILAVLILKMSHRCPPNGCSPDMYTQLSVLELGGNVIAIPNMGLAITSITLHQEKKSCKLQKGFSFSKDL